MIQKTKKCHLIEKKCHLKEKKCHQIENKKVSPNRKQKGVSPNGKQKGVSHIMENKKKVSPIEKQ